MSSLPSSVRIVFGAVKRAKHVLLAWILFNVLCGSVYYIITVNSPENGLLGAGGPITTLFDGVYFSFIAAASVGLGDILPLGASKMITIVQSLIGLLVLTLVVSEIIHGEEGDLIKKIHSYSSSDRVKRIRSGFYFFRENIEDIIEKLKKNEIHHAGVQNYLNLQCMSLTTTLREIKTLYQENVHIKKEEFEEGKMVMHMLLSLLTLKNVMKFLKKKRIPSTPQTKEEVRNIITLSREIVRKVGSDIEGANKKQLRAVTETLEEMSK